MIITFHPAADVKQQGRNYRFSLLADSNKAVLEAFFLGRAFAEAINDRLGAALGDLLSEIGKADAERRQFWK